MVSKILVVDDEPHLEVVIRQLFRKRIKAGELVIYFAANGEKAIETLEQNNDIDAVFSDINMPIMNGLSLLKRLNDRYPLIKTVVITAYGDMKNIRAAMNHGAFDFLNKPINFSDLKITLEKTLCHVRQLKDLHRERQKNFLAEKLRELTQSVNASLDPEEVLARFLDKLKGILAYDHALVYRNSGDVSLHGSEGDVKEIPETILSELGEADKPVVRSFEGNGAAGMSLLALPLPKRKDGSGLAILVRSLQTPFAALDLELAGSLLDQATLAIEHAILFEEVRRLAITDGLTKLYNRRHFLEQAQMEVVRSKRYGNPLSAIMLDLDYFKGVKDIHGHLAGDVVLEGVANAIMQVCRKTDLIGRYGGDEIAILLIETDLTLAREIAERIRIAIAHLDLHTRDNTNLNITASLGVAFLDEDDTTLNSLLETADQCLLAAKGKGRNRTETV